MAKKSESKVETKETKATFNQEEFEKKLQELLALAKDKKNVLEYQEISDHFKEMQLGPDQLEAVLDYLEKNSVDIMRLQDIEEEEILLDDEDEIEVETIDLSVPDGVSTDDPVRMYLKEIGKVPLLTAEEESELAKRMEAGNYASDLIRKKDADREELSLKYVSILEKEKELREGEITGADAVLDSIIDYAKKLQDDTLTEEDVKALRDIAAEGDEAKKRLSEANLRLVVSIAKRYVGRGMLFLDLIQEGNLGLIKAVEKFDYRKGYKFSTYATWWIRQAITRAIADQARTIRIPVHMVETINKLIRVSRQLLQELGREPSPEEIAEEMDMPVERVREILKISQEPVSLETPIGEEEDSHLGDFIQDDNVPVPADAATFTLLKEQLEEVLGTLTDREQKVLILRFGLEDGRARTLEEVGKEFNVTRERIRQIEAKALRKLRHPSRSRKLKDYLE